MNLYTPPLRDIQFVLRHLAGLEEITRLPSWDGTDPETLEAILSEGGKFAAEILAPLNSSGDREGAVWRDGEVWMPAGFRDAYAAFVRDGWNGIACEPEYGGHGMPKLVTTALREMWNSASIAFALCPALNTGAIEAMSLCASAELKHTFLPKMVSGEWTGAMCLTESQAGSDLAAVRTRAEPHTDGSYRIFGQKVFITYGEHDMAANIVHLVLARLPDAPPGTKGISMFLVPKFLVAAGGTPGARNDVRCDSIERKLGIHACPTCTMSFGSGSGAVGYLVGEPHRGLEYMFIMMNDARLVSGVQGLAVAERAYQQAAAYARQRVQGRDVVGGTGSVRIIAHPDVRRMLMLMRSLTEAMRAFALTVAAAADRALAHPDAAERARSRSFVDLMTPVFKGWCTETGVEVASLGIQVHGGAGFIEETGAAQYLRDVRVTTIYEGTTGIQANDLVGRKIMRDDGAAIRQLLDLMQSVLPELAARAGHEFVAIRNALGDGLQALDHSVEHLLERYPADPRVALAGAVPFLKLTGIVTGGWLMARAALAVSTAAPRSDAAATFAAAKLVSAQFYADHVLTLAPALARTVISDPTGLLALDEAHF